MHLSDFGKVAQAEKKAMNENVGNRQYFVILAVEYPLYTNANPTLSDSSPLSGAISASLGSY